MSTVGLAAAVLGAGAFGPQVVKMLRTRSTDDVTWWFWIAQTASVWLWLFYGWHLDRPLSWMQAANTVVLVCFAVAKGRADRHVPWWVWAYLGAAVALAFALPLLHLDLISGVAGVIGVGSWATQIAKTPRAKSSRDLSLITYALVLGSAALWIVEGVRIGGWSLVGSQAVVIPLVFVLFALALRYRERTYAA